MSQSCTCLPTLVSPYDKLIDHPCLVDIDTIKFLRKSHVVFILRGLPGSGKSYVAKQLCTLYPEHVVCSADNFFYDAETQKYVFNKNMLQEAHQYCYELALNAVEQSVKSVIIDNTNVTWKEMVSYVHLGRNHRYLILFLEPRTSWRRCVVHLAMNNCHEVSVSTISRRLKQFSNIRCRYYGWFFNRDDTEMLYECANGALAQSKVSHPFVPKPEPLHCTSIYFGKEDLDETKTRLIGQSIGKSFKMQVLGFSFDANTVCARIRLSDPRTIVLWYQDDYEQGTYSACHPSQMSVYHPSCGFGSRAHLTLWTDGETKPAVAGVDLISMIQSEHDFDGQIIEERDFVYLMVDKTKFLANLRRPLELNAVFTYGI